jgi:hypothetical protein
MYEFVDQPIDRLSRGSHFALWSMRVWACTIGRRGCGPATLAPAFARMGVVEALPDVHLALMSLNHEALEKLTLAAPAWAVVTEDEAVLLGLWRDAHIGATARLDGTLGLLIEEEAVAKASRAFTSAAAKFTAADLAPQGMAVSSAGTAN